jgi:HEAT repeat protein
MVRLLLAAALVFPQPARADAADTEPTFRHEPLKKLLAELKDKDVAVRRMAAATLGQPDGSEGKGGPRPRGDLWPAMLGLVDAQKDADMIVRFNAVQSLGLLMRFRGVPEPSDERWEKIALVAIASLNDPEDLVKTAAAGALPKIGIETKAGLAALEEMLKKDDAKVRATAATGAKGVRAAATVVPALGDRLADKNADVRLAAANTLAFFRAESVGAVKPLVAALKDEDAKVAVSAATALGSIGPPAAAAVPALVDAIHDVKSPARGSAVTALGLIHSEAEFTISALINALSSEDLRSNAFTALTFFGTAAKDAAPAILAYSRDARGTPQSYALFALAAVDPDGPEFFELLFATARDPNPAVRNLAINYFHRGYPGTLTFLATWFKADPASRQRLAMVFGPLGAEAKPIIPLLLELIGDLETNPTLRRALVNAVNRIDPTVLKPNPDDM